MRHPLEDWADARAPDGTACLIQPTIAPLYDGRNAGEILSLLTDAEPVTALDLLRAQWLDAGQARPSRRAGRPPCWPAPSPAARHRSSR